ncbi:MAG: RNA methyltransferase [Myxococcales bacterium]|nr:RNA methyltransferase [Myxococcales bacterium]
MSRTAPHRPRPCFASCDGGAERHLAAELEALGLASVHPAHRGVHFEADRVGLWRVNLHSRLANRVLMPIAEFPAASKEALYGGVRRVSWEQWFDLHRTFAVEAQGTQGRLTHTGHSALVVKDAIADRMRELRGRRPNVDRRRPEVVIHVRLSEGRAVLSLDASGARLHRRGYRREAGEAPLKETLAAGLIARSGWQPGQPFMDPMCGSGTLVIEAALQAAGRAPGLVRLGLGERFACQHWADHDGAAFEATVAEVRGAAKITPTLIVGSDVDPRMVAMARRNAERAGVADLIRFEVRDLVDTEAPAPGPGVLVSNPPYGERLGEVEALRTLYDKLGSVLKHRFSGWTAWILAGEKAPLKAIGLKPETREPLRNGPIRCELASYSLW